MHINTHRPWITPLVIGSFLLSAVTGIVIFFHWDTGLVKLAHEWLSWIMVLAVLPHVLLNMLPFKRYFTQKTGLWIVGVSAVVLALSFLSLGGNSPAKDPGFAPPIRALAKAPISVLAQVAGTSTDDVKARLQAAGYTVTSDQQSVADLAGGELRAQIGAITKVMVPRKP
jgi:hypothetical protein